MSLISAILQRMSEIRLMRSGFNTYCKHDKDSTSSSLLIKWSGFSRHIGRPVSCLVLGHCHGETPDLEGQKVYGL
jgi:hypothetical protein